MPYKDPEKRKEHLRRYSKQHKATHRSEYNERRRQRQAVRRAAGTSSSQQEIREIKTLMGGKCCRCGFDDYRALQIDHVYRHKTKLREGRAFRAEHKALLRSLRAGESTPEYQLLCANCNWIKRVENREYTKVRNAND